MNDELTAEFIKETVFRINESTKRMIICLDDVDEADLWKRPNELSNSIGNIVLHLCGNITQYIISGLGGAIDARQRDKEFSARGGYSRDELKQLLTNTLRQAISVIQTMDIGLLLKIRKVQGFEISGTGILIHVTEHYSYHTGQVAFWTKFLKNKDLGFYAGIDLNKKNQG